MGLWLKQDDGTMVEVSGGGGGDGGSPHDHDYLPLTGGTLVGDGAVLSFYNLTPTGQPYMNFYHDGVRRGYLGNATDTTTEFSAETNQLVLGGNGVRVSHTDLTVDGTITDVNGPVRSFAIADGIDTADVLDRAETATMPALDDEGVATTDAEVEAITVNEVVTALLAKVKELSARIEAMEK